jgi:D-3-phosphoglycerate dehydrogenase
MAMPNQNKTYVLITGKLHPEIIAEISTVPGAEIHNHPDANLDEIKEQLKKASILITRSETAVDKKLIDTMTNLRFVIRAAVGVGNIDLDYATEKGIMVMNCPGKNTNSAAELCIGLLLSCIRNLDPANRKVKSGGWDRHKFVGNELRGKRVAVIGLGNVGHRMAKFLNGFDADVVGYDPFISSEKFKSYGVEMADSLESALKNAYAVSVHTPLSEKTRGLIGEKELAMLAPNAVVINGARGGIVCEKSLLNALESGAVARAGIDTWINEPSPLPALAENPQVVCSPHIGASTFEAQIAIGKAVIAQLKQALSDQIVDHPVNLPGVEKIEHPVVQQYAVLAEKLGTVASSVLAFQPEVVTVKLRGEIAAMKTSTIPVAFAKGFMRGKVSEHVSFVNARQLLEKSGVKLAVEPDPQFNAYRSAIKIEIQGTAAGDSEKPIKDWKIGGTVFEDKLQRLSLIDQFYFEVEPKGNLLLFKNQDEPGVVGNIGTLLGTEGVNIQSFDLARKPSADKASTPGLAMAVVRTDSQVGPDLIAKLKKLPHIQSVWAIVL